MKMSRACPDMLSSENDDFQFLKTAINIKCTCIMCTIVPGLVELFYHVFASKHHLSRFVMN